MTDHDFRFLAEHSTDILCRFGMDRHLHYVSPASLRVLGYLPEEMMALSIAELVVAEDLPALLAVMEAHLGGAEPAPHTCRYRRKDGKVIWLEVSPGYVYHPKTGVPTDVILIMHDVSAHMLLEEKLAALAMTDGLTGIANRRAFDEALEREWQGTLRAGACLSLLLDVDHFKQFNDVYGHQVGDDCLRSVAQTVQRIVAGGAALAARYGGEELAIILPGTDSADAMEVASQIRAEVHRLRIPHMASMAGGGFLTVSIGVATAIAQPGGSMKMPEGLLLSADHALYKAKRQGRNCVECTIIMATSQAA